MKFLFILLLTFSFQIFPSDQRIISITQIPCQFLELEAKDLGYQSKQESDCSNINTSTLNERKKMFQPLRLKAGNYIFRVMNKGIPYEVGFWLRGTGFNRLILPSVSGGGLYSGETKDYQIKLRSGNYKISCPLNSTPDYDLIVE